jgi:Lipoprotein confined to pathogenic Mycobacterium
VVSLSGLDGVNLRWGDSSTVPGAARLLIRAFVHAAARSDAWAWGEARVSWCTQITTAASQLIPTITWETPQEGSGDNCERPYEQTDGKRYFLPNEVAAKVDVSESNWAKIQQAAKDAAAKLDATEVQVMKDQPGNHDVGFYGPTGLFIKVSYGGNLVIGGYTGCRLPRDKK